MPLNSPTHKPETGALYVVASPIGNLEDITFRAVRVLNEADLVIAEDTRTAKRLFAAHGITTHLVSFHEHNERDKTEAMIQRIVGGQTLALLSEAGTPLISDPGFPLVRAAAGAGLAVIPIPGPSAAVAALSASGLPTDSFFFAGFLPKKASAREKRLAELSRCPATVVFYESPRRALDLVRDLFRVFGDREAVLAREVTKVHEEFLRGPLAVIEEDLASRDKVRGEVTLLVAGFSGEAGSGEDLERELEQALAEGGESLSALSSRLAKEFGRKKSEVYQLALDRKDKAAQG